MRDAQVATFAITLHWNCFTGLHDPRDLRCWRRLRRLGEPRGLRCWWRLGEPRGHINMYWWCGQVGGRRLSPRRCRIGFAARCAIHRWSGGRHSSCTNRWGRHWWHRSRSGIELPVWWILQWIPSSFAVLPSMSFISTLTTTVWTVHTTVSMVGA